MYLVRENFIKILSKNVIYLTLSYRGFKILRNKFNINTITKIPQIIALIVHNIIHNNNDRAY